MENKGNERKSEEDSTGVIFMYNGQETIQRPSAPGARFQPEGSVDESTRL